MSDALPFALDARAMSALYLATAWAVYCANMKSESEAHKAHLAALRACSEFERDLNLIQTGIMKPMGEWAKSIILKNPDSTAIWTVTFHDLIDLAERELERYDGIMAKTHKDEGDAEWRVERGSRLTYLHNLGVVAGEEKKSRWEERKAILRRAVGSAKLKTKRSLSRLRETLRGKKDE